MTDDIYDASMTTLADAKMDVRRLYAEVCAKREKVPLAVKHLTLAQVLIPQYLWRLLGID